MNIIVFGGGKVGKFGHDFCLKARQEGHKVIIFSHKLNGTNDPDQYVIDYNDLNQVADVFKVCDNLAQIDLVFFNQVGGLYPCEADLFQEPNTSLYISSLNSIVTIPHLFISKFSNKFHSDTKIINMTTNIAFDYDKNPHIAGLVGYAGSKAWSTHLIQGYANHRDRKSTFFTISPSMNYEAEDYKDKYPVWFNSLYNLIFSADDKFNGKIVTAWHLNEHKLVKTSLHITEIPGTSNI